MSFGLYVHLPFCSALCPYCDFAVVVGKPELHERYCAALLEEARAAAPVPPIATMFIGGGTPSFIEPRLLGRTLRELRSVLPVDDDAEVTAEANPESIRPRALLEAGVNRLSIGAQSFDDGVLRALGRTHTAADVARAVRDARAAGARTISLDLIYGGPGETDGSWERTLQQALALEPDHVSCYALTIEDRTPFGRAVARGAMAAPDDDVLASRYERAREVLASAGYRHYEVSNWARPGAECKHNLLYWTQGEYLGLGLGAHSHRDGVRWWNTRSLPAYLSAPAAARAGEERLDAAQRAEEWLSLRLRLLEGTDLEEARARLGRALEVGPLVRAGLADARGGRLTLTRRGMLLENEVAARLLG